MTRNLLGALTFCAAAALALTACGSSSAASGSSSSGSSSSGSVVSAPSSTGAVSGTVVSGPSLSAAAAMSTAGVDAAARALLPADLKAKGVIVDGVNLPNPPMEFSDTGSTDPKGLDIDLAKALAVRLGLTIRFDNVQFDQLLPGLATKRDDMVLSALSDTPERQKVADWVDYFNSGDRFFTSAANAAKYPDYASLCGQTVVLATGTSFVQDVPALSATVCAGKAPIKVLAVGISGNAGLELQLTTGRAVAAVTGAETYGYLTQTESGKWAAVGDIFAASPYGIAVRKDDTGLRDALRTALSNMHKDGSYQKILATWSQQASALTDITVNLEKNQ